MSTQSKVIKPTITLSSDVVAIARKVGTQIKGANKVAVELGKLALQAANLVTAETLDAFIVECKKACGDAPEGTVKVYMSNVRGVIRAIHDGYEPEAGTSIKAMYSAAPKGKGANAGNTKGSRVVKGRDQSGTKEPAKAREMTMADAALFVFGHVDDELVAALEWAKQNELAFVRYVKANVAAASAPVEVAKPATVRKIRKAA